MSYQLRNFPPSRIFIARGEFSAVGSSKHASKRKKLRAINFQIVETKNLNKTHYFFLAKKIIVSSQRPHHQLLANQHTPYQGWCDNLEKIPNSDRRQTWIEDIFGSKFHILPIRGTQHSLKIFDKFRPLW